MEILQYSPENLRFLINQSDAYKGLSAQEKEVIENHIKANNKPILLYLFQQLREEYQSISISRENLAKKVLQINQPSQSTVTEAIRQNFSRDQK